jgi:hypothetical protein
LFPYNANVNENDKPTPDGSEEQQTGDVTEGVPGAPSNGEQRPEPPVLVPMAPSSRWRGGGGPSRWTSFGCVVGILFLIALLVFGVAITKRTAWMALDRSSRRFLAAVERNNRPGDRMRTSRNLERFRTQLRISRDPYPLMGEFLKQVQETLEDGSLTAEEIEHVNLFLESTLPSVEGAVVRP